MRPFEADRRVYLLLSAAPAERGRRRRAAEGPRGAARLRGDRARGGRPRPDPGDDPLALPARALHAAVASARSARLIDARAPELDEAAARRARARRRRPARPPRAAARPARRRAGATCCSSRRVPRTASRASSRPTRRQRCSSPPGERGAEARELEEVKVQGLELAAREPPSSGCAAPSAAPSARSCWRSSRSSPPGTATWSSSASAPRRRRSTSTASTSCGRTPRASALLGAERAAEAVRETWRRLEEFNLAPQLALEALFVQLARELQA